MNDEDSAAASGGAVTEVRGVSMQRSAVESALLDAVLDVMPVSDMALEAVVVGVPVLDVPRSSGVDVVVPKDGWDI